MKNEIISDLIGFDEKKRQNIEVINFFGDTLEEFISTESNIIIRYNYYFKNDMSLERITQKAYSVKFRGLEFFCGTCKEIKELTENILNQLKEKNSKDFIFENADQWAYLNFSIFNLNNGKSVLMYSSDTFSLKYVVSLEKLKIKESIKKTNPIGVRFENKQSFKAELMKIVEESYSEISSEIKCILK